MFKNLSFVALLATTLALGACASPEQTKSGDIALGDAELSGIGKADHMSLEFSQIYAPIDPALLERGGAAIVTSADSYLEYFGQPAPSDIDFDHEWVAFFGSGTRNTGGYGAAITGLTLLPEWYGALVMETQESSPGDDCFVTMAITWPHTLVKFERPQYEPSWFSLDSESEVYKCGPSNDDRLAELASSLETWNEARDANDNSYTYTTEWQSFSGWGGRTTLVVDAGAVVERHYKAQHIDGGDSTAWSELGTDVGSHNEGAAPVVIDDLYVECAEEILTLDEETHWIDLFVDSTDGIMRSCHGTHRLCMDDCTRGPSITTLTF